MTTRASSQLLLLLQLLRWRLPEGDQPPRLVLRAAGHLNQVVCAARRCNVRQRAKDADAADLLLGQSDTRDGLEAALEALVSADVLP